MTGEIVTGDGCRIAYRIDGPEGAPVLMLGNSLGTTMAMWDAQVAAFAAGYRVLRYDGRGHGASGVPAGGYSLDRLGRDAIELLDGLGINRVHFCGLSMGGMVGQWLGIQAPERIGRLILANTSGYMGPPAGWDARIAAVTAGGMAAMVDAVLERWFTPEFRAAGGAALDAVRGQLLATDPRGYAGCCAAIRDMDMRRTAALIELPVLVIGGDRDPSTPIEHGRAIVDVVAGARLEVLAAAHLSNVERPGEFAAAVTGFLG